MINVGDHYTSGRRYDLKVTAITAGWVHYEITAVHNPLTNLAIGMTFKDPERIFLGAFTLTQPVVVQSPAKRVVNVGDVYEASYNPAIRWRIDAVDPVDGLATFTHVAGVGAGRVDRCPAAHFSTHKLVSVSPWNIAKDCEIQDFKAASKPKAQLTERERMAIFFGSSVRPGTWINDKNNPTS